MLHHLHPKQQREVGRVASRLLSIPALLVALVAGYVALLAVQDESTILAKASTPAQIVPDTRESNAPPVAATTQPDATAAVSVPSPDAIEELDPVGAGRNP